MQKYAINIDDKRSRAIENWLFQRALALDSVVVIIYAVVTIVLIVSTKPYVYPLDDAAQRASP